MSLQKIIFKNVQEIIINNDPVGLVDGGAPDDEYDTEIGKIVILLRSETNKKLLSEKVRAVFKETFGDDISQDKNLYLLISEKLLEVKNRLHW